MTSGGQYVMMAGTPLMLLLSASSWDMQLLEVSLIYYLVGITKFSLACSADGLAYYSAYFGAGTGPIYLDDVACTSSASQLLECSSRPILAYNCDHHDDAGVGCEGNTVSFV